jgi:hypothetical protein
VPENALTDYNARIITLTEHVVAFRLPEILVREAQTFRRSEDLMLVQAVGGSLGSMRDSLINLLTFSGKQKKRGVERRSLCLENLQGRRCT